ncbi:conserved hypothetical protein [Flavobacterium sp. 9AF]|uniref:hypothetical protein n=1 Tax=Flavobacterium sp. 9AF TaxID=2653142 RepID=UPI0012F124BD|nr:hypothetical protein [Flavobacterium sp. 9AF]VXB32239.1 conserved hypothetical protein [Flavobacterium sp. 9AF]
MYKCISWFISFISIISCNSTKERVAHQEKVVVIQENNSQDTLLPIKELYYQKWVAGIKGGGSGIDFYIELKEALNKDIFLENVRYDVYDAIIEKISETSYVAHMRTPLNDMILDENPQKEYGNQAPATKLKTNEAIITFTVNNKRIVQKFENVKEKELLAYPSMKPKNNEE